MIDITKPVRTKDGQRVEIFSDKGREPYPLIGYIGDSTALGTWTKDGMFFEQESSHHDIENYEPRPVRWNCLDPLPEPQPEEWAAEKAAFAAGKVIQYRGGESSMWHDTVIPTWQSCCQYRIKPEPQWKLPDPPEGQKWHRDDWTEDMLPEGYRPLLFGEVWCRSDEYYSNGRWQERRHTNWLGQAVDEYALYPCRTKRPLPEPKPEEWAAEKAAFVEGRAIQFQPKGFNKWLDCLEPTWRSDLKYRIKPEPQWVPMEPCDVPCLSLIKAGGVEAAVLRVSTHGVYICGLAGNIYEVEYDELFEDWQIKRPSEGWKPCKKEVQV